VSTVCIGGSKSDSYVLSHTQLNLYKLHVACTYYLQIYRRRSRGLTAWLGALKSPGRAKSPWRLVLGAWLGRAWEGLAWPGWGLQARPGTTLTLPQHSELNTDPLIALFPRHLALQRDYLDTLGLWLTEERFGEMSSPAGP
jgi:hypothetical protein